MLHVYMSMTRLLSALAILLLVIPAYSQIAATAEETKSLAKGAKAPAGELHAADGKVIKLAELAKAKPVALVFYRGHWCPLCMRHLKKFETSAAAFKEAGYQLIAVAPDTVKQVEKTQAKLGLSYPLYADSDSTLAQAFGIAFKAKRNMTLPTPAVYVIAADGTLVYAHADANYRKRLAPEMVLAALKKK